MFGLARSMALKVVAMEESAAEQRGSGMSLRHPPFDCFQIEFEIGNRTLRNRNYAQGNMDGEKHQ